MFTLVVVLASILVLAMSCGKIIFNMLSLKNIHEFCMERWRFVHSQCFNNACSLKSVMGGNKQLLNFSPITRFFLFAGRVDSAKLVTVNEGSEAVTVLVLVPNTAPLIDNAPPTTVLRIVASSKICVGNGDLNSEMPDHSDNCHMLVAASDRKSVV